MSDSSELSDWELLPNSPNSPTPFEEFDPESDAIRLDYFAFDSGDRIPKKAPSDEEERLAESTVVDSIGSGEKGGIFLEEEKTCELELGLAESGRMGDCAEEGKLAVGFDEVTVLEGGAIGETEEFDGNGVFRQEVTELGLAEPVRVEDRGAEEPRLDVGAAIGRVEEIGEAERMEDVGELAVGVGEGAKGVSVWLKMPLELLKMCVLKVRPVWSISIAAGIIGMLMLGRRLYKMKGKNRGIPLKISLDDKKAAQLVVRAGRLSESFSAVRRVPFVRLPPPSGSVSLWPVAGSLRALDW